MRLFSLLRFAVPVLLVVTLGACTSVTKPASVAAGPRTLIGIGWEVKSLWSMWNTSITTLVAPSATPFARITKCPTESTVAIAALVPDSCISNSSTADGTNRAATSGLAAGSRNSMVRSLVAPPLGTLIDPVTSPCQTVTISLPWCEMTRPSASNGSST